MPKPSPCFRSLVCVPAPFQMSPKLVCFKKTNCSTLTEREKPDKFLNFYTHSCQHITINKCTTQRLLYSALRRRLVQAPFLSFSAPATFRNGTIFNNFKHLPLSFKHAPTLSLFHHPFYSSPSTTIPYPTFSSSTLSFMTASSSTRSTSPSPTSQTNSLMRKKFWDTVLNAPEAPQHLTTSPLSRSSNQTTTESLPLVLPQHYPTSATSSTTFQTTHKPSYGERNTSTQREIESWQKTRKARPFKCSICQSCYAQKGDMVRHMRCVHEGLRPFQCTVCGNAFGRRSILNKHMKRHWKNTEDTQYPVNLEKRLS